MHLFNRFYQATLDEVFADASRYWLEQTLGYYKPGTGFAGFTAYRRTQDGVLGHVGYPGLLEGSTGVGLALLAAVSEVEPEWDRALLIDLPRCPQ